MSSILIGRLLTRGWMLLVVLVAVAAAGLCDYRLHSIFRSHYTTLVLPWSYDVATTEPAVNAYTFCSDKSG